MLSQQEFENRTKKVIAAMSDRGLDALVLLDTARIVGGCTGTSRGEPGQAFAIGFHPRT